MLPRGIYKVSEHNSNKSAEPLLSIGSEIDGYRIISLLGAGGMGFVYLVKNIEMHKLYALKRILPDFFEAS
jgi:serine/threonine protein kinase